MHEEEQHVRLPSGGPGRGVQPGELVRSCELQLGEPGLSQRCLRQARVSRLQLSQFQLARF